MRYVLSFQALPLTGVNYFHLGGCNVFVELKVLGTDYSWVICKDFFCGHRSIMTKSVFLGEAFIRFLRTNSSLAFSGRCGCIGILQHRSDGRCQIVLFTHYRLTTFGFQRLACIACNRPPYFAALRLLAKPWTCLRRAISVVPASPSMVKISSRSWSYGRADYCTW